MKTTLTLLLALLLAPLAALYADEKAHFIVEPEIFIHHTPERSFIGPGMFVLENGDILMAAPWGRPPTNFEQLAAKFPVPMLYRSTDGGRTWKEQGRMKMAWKLTGLISDGGTSFLRLADGRIGVVFNRHVKGLHGGGTPVIAFSADNGQTWTAASVLIENDDAFYVMNDRLIQLRSGRLVLPVARKVGKTEGDRDEGLAMLSDDAGATWRLSRGAARIEAPRGMAEPCVAELGDGRVLMMARTGLGSLHTAESADGGETWSKPEATTLESACSSLTLKTLPDGRLIVFYNHATPIKAGAFFPRTPLCYAVSGDGGRTWSPPVVVDDEGVANKDRQNIYPSICFTNKGMVVMWSTHGADPKGSFAGQYDAKIGGGKRAILAMPAKSLPKTAAKPDLVPVQLAASAKPADESQVWAADEAGLKAHHIFGLCRSEKGTVLAFCEGRIQPHDFDPHHLLLKRSTDRGATWGQDIFVERSDGQESFVNPTPLVDRRTGRIFLFYALNIDNQRSQVFYRTSDDDGVTWSDRTDVTRLFDGDPLKRPFHLPGPGHAVQLHSGRLVVPIWHRLALSRDYKSPPWEKRLYATSVITSDDGGKTWRAGDFTPPEYHCNESRVVELSDGQLLLNARSVGFLQQGEKRRVEARSRDAGATWASSGWAETFPSSTPCDTGFIRLYHGPAKDKDWLVFSWPDHLTKRVDMTVALSTDGGRTWAARRRVAPMSGYSDLVELDDGSIGLLYGGGYTNGGIAVRFARFGLDWLNGGQPPPDKQALPTSATGPRGALELNDKEKP